MAHPILMPKPGQMTEECVLVAWHKKEGDPVKKGDVLFEIETDKSNMDVEAFEEGVLLKRVVQEGQTVAVNAVCAYVGEPGEAIPDAPEAAAPAVAAPAVAAAPATAPAAPTAVPSVAVAAAFAAAPSISVGEVRLRISPRASRLAADSGIDPRTITGTGPEGRITERDVKTAVEATSVRPPAQAAGVATPAAWAGGRTEVASTAVLTSRSVIRPSGPVPVIVRGSMPESAANRLARGLMRRRTSPTEIDGAAAKAAATATEGTAVGAAGAVAGAAATAGAATAGAAASGASGMASPGSPT